MVEPIKVNPGDPPNTYDRDPKDPFRSLTTGILPDIIWERILTVKVKRGGILTNKPFSVRVLGSVWWGTSHRPHFDRCTKAEKCLYHKQTE